MKLHEGLYSYQTDAWYEVWLAIFVKSNVHFATFLNLLTESDLQPWIASHEMDQSPKSWQDRKTQISNDDIFFPISESIVRKFHKSGFSTHLWNF